MSNSVPSVPPPRRKASPSRKSAIDVVPLRARVPFLLGVLVILIAILLPPASVDSLGIQKVLGQPGTALILTAHPDDEVMFFSPTILGLQEAGWNITGLCLSNGNADGLGYLRRHELTQSYAKLGVAPEDVLVVDHPLLQDSMDHHWPQKIIQDVVSSHLDDHHADLVVTFDKLGVSAHSNHASLSTFRPRNGIKLAHLQSPPLWTKYTGPLTSMAESVLGLPLAQTLSSVADSAVGLVKPGRSLFSSSDATLRLRSDRRRWWRAVDAMRQHQSQMVWFRWLYLGSSQLLWTNTLEVI